MTDFEQCDYCGGRPVLVDDLITHGDVPEPRAWTQLYRVLRCMCGALTETRISVQEYPPGRADRFGTAEMNQWSEPIRPLPKVGD